MVGFRPVYGWRSSGSTATHDNAKDDGEDDNNSSGSKYGVLDVRRDATIPLGPTMNHSRTSLVDNNGTKRTISFAVPGLDLEIVFDIWV